MAPVEYGLGLVFMVAISLLSYASGMATERRRISKKFQNLIAQAYDNKRNPSSFEGFDSFRDGVNHAVNTLREAVK